MTDTEFEALAGTTLETVERGIEAAGLDIDIQAKGAGVLELEFQDGSKMIINRHAAAREIWVAAKSGGYHFRWNGSNWVDTRDGGELFATLSTLVGGQSGSRVILRSE